VIALWGEGDVQRLLGNAGIIRHRGKIEATITNAQAWLRMEERCGFDRFMWDYVGGAPLQNRFASQAEVPPKTALSEQVSKDLKKAGFKFCGPTIVYAWMEACGLVNDHLVGCPRHDVCAGMAAPR
jgi:DNA-3-methyladenine glycosylase I